MHCSLTGCAGSPTSCQGAVWGSPAAWLGESSSGDIWRSRATPPADALSLWRIHGTSRWWHQHLRLTLLQLWVLLLILLLLLPADRLCRKSYAKTGKRWGSIEAEACLSWAGGHPAAMAGLNCLRARRRMDTAQDGICTQQTSQMQAAPMSIFCNTGWDQHCIRNP